jgi:hypothetical protein
MNRAAPCCRTLTAARLDRDADLDRDLGAVATALQSICWVHFDNAVSRVADEATPDPARPSVI